MFDLLAQNITFFLHQAFFYWVGEEGEEKHPPVGKNINRPKIHNHSPPCRYDVGSTQFLGHSRVVTCLGFMVQFPRILRGVHAS